MRPPLAARAGRSVYGLTIFGLDGHAELNARDPAGADEVAVQVELIAGRRPDEHAFDERRSVESFGPAHRWVLDRFEGSARLIGPALARDLVAHPGLAPVATAFNRWAGRESFHAASVVLHGRAYGVIGARTAGKSTLMAGLAANGALVLSDDIVVTDGHNVFAGPRCIDLRTPIPGLNLATVSARLGTRWRVPLPPVPVSLPLGGWIFLRWGPELSMRLCPPALVLARMAGWRGRRALPSDPTVLLDLATRPAWDLIRPRAWSSFDDVTHTLTRTVAELASESVP